MIVPEGFSTLQRVEIAEIQQFAPIIQPVRRFSTLQRVEIAEIGGYSLMYGSRRSFSTLQRVEIAETCNRTPCQACSYVSVLFNESKLLKRKLCRAKSVTEVSFSTLQRVEIAETRTNRHHDSSG